ncbi:hypothetical protein [Nostocoides veronense]|uniref:Uncharacterized protein n=1 Tax=Nostocoides veronense TaxID=330836 RepID=A0ABN2LYA7_9MICO
MTRRIPTWPPGPRLPLISPALVIGLLPLGLFVMAIAWYSFAPAPNFLLLAAILIASWVLLWLVIRAIPAGHRHSWSTYQDLPRRQRGRDSRVALLRAALSGETPADVESLQRLLRTLVADRLRRRGLNPDRLTEEAQALLGPELLTYLQAPVGSARRSAHDIDRYLQRIERI